MARRLIVAALLALAGLRLLAFAELPAWAMGRPFHSVPVRATIVDNAIEQTGSGPTALRLCTLHWQYVFEGRSYEASYAAQDRVRLWPGPRQVGDLRAGETMDVWIDPTRPGSAALHEDRPLGNDLGMILLGIALVIAAAAVSLSALARRRG
ncbi:DUF3592 domain-containing protein [Scleromatobacter humisilvae]|uniref:DUF3592 domain-containing protein n=1 Tax=Scleromatobacter humisilvae TaxID=2897159 RepID=A0A9X1YQ48_9BURK|nr:DUF3592 domain-containing protein [Scleromatobacter humisilvae]MCK9688777.1 DUF3592 domain-containing protein [Scleromatobacter humisilvae]